MRRIAAVLLVASGARAARFEVAPFLQDARPDGAVVVFETDPPIAAAVLVEDRGAERRFPSPRGVHHEVRLSGLAPGGHRYRVVLGDDPGAATPPAELQTAPTPGAGAEFSFLVYGDNRDRDDDHARVVAAMLRERAAFLINTGDLTGDAGIDALWRRFFHIEAELLASTPMYPALGNHELLHDPQALHFHRYFALPDDAPVPEDRERYYAFRYGNAELIALDGNQSGNHAQAAWLDGKLRAARANPAVQHVFVFFHQPSFAVGDFCGSGAEQGLWVPRFEQYGVRAVFTGHEHTYERLERKGVRYFVTGGGGAPLMKQREDCPAYDREALRMFRPVHHFLRVRIRGAEALLDAIGVDGEVFDSVRLHEAAAPAPATAVPFRHRIEASPAPATPGIEGYAWRLLAVVAALGAAILIGLAIAVRIVRRKRT